MVGTGNAERRRGCDVVEPACAARGTGPGLTVPGGIATKPGVAWFFTSVLALRFLIQTVGEVAGLHGHEGGSGRTDQHKDGQRAGNHALSHLGLESAPALQRCSHFRP